MNFKFKIYNNNNNNYENNKNNDGRKGALCPRKVR